MTEAQADSAKQVGRVQQNQNTAAILAAHGADDEERAAYALDDPRYAGGDVYDPKANQLVSSAWPACTTSGCFLRS
jgi:hypothetical protein